jgi:hypothetical protein
MEGEAFRLRQKFSSYIPVRNKENPPQTPCTRAVCMTMKDCCAAQVVVVQRSGDDLCATRLFPARLKFLVSRDLTWRDFRERVRRQVSMVAEAVVLPACCHLQVGGASDDEHADSRASSDDSLMAAVDEANPSADGHLYLTYRLV